MELRELCSRMKALSPVEQEVALSCIPFDVVLDFLTNEVKDMIKRNETLVDFVENNYKRDGIQNEK